MSELYDMWIYLKDLIKKKKKKKQLMQFSFSKVFPIRRKEGRKTGSKENNLTHRIHGMNELKTFDSIRDHSIWFDKRSFYSVSYFYWWGNRPEEWKCAYLESHTWLPVTPKPSFSVLFVWFCLVWVVFLFFKYIVMIFIIINSIINEYWCLKRHIVSKSETE